MPPRDPASALLAACRAAHLASPAGAGVRAEIQMPQDLAVDMLWARLPEWFVYSDPRRLIEIAAFGVAEPWRAEAPLVHSRLNDSAGDAVAPDWVGVLPFRGARAAWTGAGPFAGGGVGAFYRPRLVVWRRGNARGAWLAVDANTRSWLQEVRPIAPAQRVEAVHTPSISNELEQRFISRVALARDAIMRGAFEKVVVARSARVAAPPGHSFDVQSTLHALRNAHPTAVVFGVGLGDGTAFVGATPELLVRTDGRDVETQALAGTAPAPHDRGGIDTPAGGLEGSQKDRGEQAVVASVITAALAPLCETLTVSAPTVLTASHLQHLTSSVRGELRAPTHVLELVRRLHPTPAVGGAPREAAERWLLETEPLDRGLYAGPVGFVDGAGGGQFNVAIRSAHIAPHEATAYTGAGVVHDSDPESEWRETELKLSVVRAGLRVTAR